MEPPNQGLVVPGQYLGPSSKYSPGPATYLQDGAIFASLLGHVSISQPPPSASAAAASGGTSVATPKPPGPAKRLTKITAPSSTTPAAAAAAGAASKELATISVRHAPAAERAESRREVLPEVGARVLCRVTRVMTHQAVVEILVVGDTVLQSEWQGVIRVQDIRATEKDRVKVAESFRPGDVVRAQVVS